MHSQGSNDKKELNFELNLMPVIDILTVCICFMLMTVVWIQVGALSSSQSMGGQTKTAKQNPPSVWVYLNPQGEIKLSLRDVPSKEIFAREVKLPGFRGQVNWNLVESAIERMERQAPSIKTALIMPSEKIAYDDIIQLMSQFKKVGIRDVGISPL